MWEYLLNVTVHVQIRKESLEHALDCLILQAKKMRAKDVNHVSHHYKSTTVEIPDHSRHSWSKQKRSERV